MQVFGWLVVVAAVIAAFVFYRRSTAPAPQGAAAAAPPPNRALALGSALVAVVIAFWLAQSATPSAASLPPKLVEDFSTDPAQRGWVFNVPAQVGWDQKNGRLLAKMKVGEGWWGVVPVDWEGDVFRAEWDITILKRDLDPNNEGPGAVAGVGMLDGSVSNIDDTDHVAGSSIMAVFADNVRLRVSDVNLLVKSVVSKTPIEIGKTYHSVLSYDRRANTAELHVTEQGGAEVANLKIEDLRDLSSSIKWFGVTMKGFSRNKTKTAKGATSAGLFIDAAIDNVKYAQP